MAQLSIPALVAMGVVLALWVGIALALAVRARLQLAQAARSQSQTGRLAALVDTAPAVPVVVRADGRIEAPERLARWLGLPQVPVRLDELSNTDRGIDPVQFDKLRQDVAAAQRSSKPFERVINPVGSDRMLTIRGVPAPPQLGVTGSAVLWVFDTTERERESMTLRAQREDAVTAFQALSGLIEMAPVPMWFRDRNQKITLVNRAYVDATGATGPESVVSHGTELVEAVGGIDARAAAAQAQQDDRALRRLIPVTTHGQRRMMEVVDIPINDVGVAGYALDRQEAEDVRAEYRRFVDARRAMLDQMSAAVAQFAGDRTLTFANESFRRLFGIDVDWVATSPEFDRLLDRMRDADRVPEVRDFPAWREDRRAWFSSPDLVEESWQLRDGSHLRIVIQPTPDGGLLLIVEDRTEQVQLASARDTLLRVRTASFDNLFEAVAVFGADGHLHLWNQRFRQIWKADEDMLAAHPRIDALLGQLADRLEKPQQAAVVQQILHGATVERRRRNGQIGFADGRRFDFAAIPLPDGNSLFTMIDVTDSRQMQHALEERNQALEAADKVKTDFLSRMSYELRTPLTSIGGFAELLDGNYAGELPEAARSYVKAIIDSSAVLARQIDTMLDLAQSEAGTLPIEQRKVDLAELIEAAIREIRTSGKADDTDLVVELAPSLGAVSGDARRIRQAIDHLLDNALRYTAQDRKEEGARVLVHADGNRQGARIVVSDNGPGIPADIRKAVLSSRGKDRSAGFGLALARQLVEAHGGNFDIVSEPGEGTMVVMNFPRNG